MKNPSYSLDHRHIEKKKKKKKTANEKQNLMVNILDQNYTILEEIVEENESNVANSPMLQILFTSNRNKCLPTSRSKHKLHPT